MKENKMGTMEVRRLILTMSLPIMISMLVQALYNIVDSMLCQGQRSGAGGGLTVLSDPDDHGGSGLRNGGRDRMLCFPATWEKRNRRRPARWPCTVCLCHLQLAVFAVIGLFFSEAFLRLFSDDVQIAQ